MTYRIAGPSVRAVVASCCTSFAELLRQLLAARTNMNTAANPDSRWLFPGGRAGQPLTAGTLAHQRQILGISTNQSRTAALRELTLQAPAPVVAEALGYGANTAHRHRHAAAGTWSRYPAIRPLTTNTTQTNLTGHQ